MKRAFRNPWLRLALAVCAALLLAWGLLRLFAILTPFVVAFGLAYFLNPAVNALEALIERALSHAPRLRRRIEPRVLAVGLLAAVVLVAFVVTLLILAPPVRLTRPTSRVMSPPRPFPNRVNDSSELSVSIARDGVLMMTLPPAPLKSVSVSTVLGLPKALSPPIVALSVAVMTMSPPRPTPELALKVTREPPVRVNVAVSIDRAPPFPVPSARLKRREPVMSTRGAAR